MAYVKNNWKDQEVERPRTYEMTNNADGSVTLIDSFGLVSEFGTAVNADNMNHIEEGIAGCDIRKYTLIETYEKGEWVTGTIDGEKSIYTSLTDNNQGNPLTDTEHWKEISFGGGSGNMVPYSYGMYMYLDYEMENACWLKSAGQYNSGTVYSGLYQWLQAERAKGMKQQYGWVYASGGTVWTLSATPAVGDAVYGYGPRKLNGYVTAIDGDSMTFHRLNETTDQNVTRDTTKDTSGYISVFSDVPVFTPSEITSTNWGYDFDYAWVINTANQTFRVPLKTKTAPLGATAPVVTTAGVTEFNVSYGPTIGIRYGHGSCPNASSSGTDDLSFTRGGTATDGMPTGLKTNLSNADSPEGVYLYFYAGNVEENADLINMGEITNALTNKADTASVTALCMPDYENAVAGLFNAWQTVTRDSFVYAGNTLRKNFMDMKLKDKNGKPIPSASLNTSEAGMISSAQKINDDGHFVLHALVPKGYSYYVKVTALEDNAIWVAPLKGAITN